MRSLVMDRDGLDRLLMFSYLRDLGGCHMAKDEDHALALFARRLSAGHPYDLVVASAAPDGPGVFHALGRMRSLEGGRAHRCVILLATTLDTPDAGAVDALLAAGVIDAYLLKPVLEYELLDLLDRLRGRLEAQPAF